LPALLVLALEHHAVAAFAHQAQVLVLLHRAAAATARRRGAGGHRRSLKISIAKFAINKN
jgi:hypothetical protein